MLSAIPVALVTVPAAVGTMLASSRTLRVVAVALLIVREMTRRYPIGEGPLSIKRRVAVIPGEGLGGIVYDLAQVYPALKPFENTVFTMTMTELRTFGFLVEAVAANEFGVSAIADYMKNFPRKESP